MLSLPVALVLSLAAGFAFAALWLIDLAEDALALPMIESAEDELMIAGLAVALLNGAAVIVGRRIKRAARLRNPSDPRIH